LVFQLKKESIIEHTSEASILSEFGALLAKDAANVVFALAALLVSGTTVSRG
jgi:hypothetical protein